MTRVKQWFKTMGKGSKSKKPAVPSSFTPPEGKPPPLNACPTLTDEERALLLLCVMQDSTLWRAEALGAYEQVSNELERASTSGTAAEHEVRIARKDLDVALRIMARRSEAGHGNPWRWFKSYYSGAEIEQTWAAIHRANATLHMLYRSDELPAQAMRLRNLVDGLPDLKPQLTTLVEEVTKSERPPPQDAATGGLRAMLREIYEEAIGAVEALQVEARVLRNVMLVASAALFVVAAVLAVAHTYNQHIIPVCIEPASGLPTCPTGSTKKGVDVFVIELAGMLGGILSVVIPLATGERIKTPYRVFNHQMLLKVMAGAATALAGIILIESGIVSGIELHSPSEILGYAVFFGFSQQALTGVIDRRATSLAEKTPTTKSV